jgi:hypothetical protein
VPAPEKESFIACVLGYMCDLRNEKEKEKFQLLSYVSGMFAYKMRNDDTFPLKMKRYLEINKDKSFSDFPLSNDFLSIILEEGYLSQEEYNKLINL